MLAKFCPWQVSPDLKFLLGRRMFERQSGWKTVAQKKALNSAYESVMQSEYKGKQEDAKGVASKRYLMYSLLI